MNRSPAFVSIQRGLLRLSGRSLWAYRAAWLLLTLVAVAALGSTLFDGSVQPLVLGLRLVKSAILLAVALVLFWKRPRDPVAAILALAFLCWTVTSSVDFTSADVWPMLLDRLRFLLFALALLLFPDGKWRPRWTHKIAVASSIVFTLGLGETLGLVPTRLFLPLAILCVVGAILSLIVRFRRTTSEMQQQQLKWVSFGLVSGVSLILSARAGAVLAGPRLAFEALFQLGIVLVALGFLVPLLRYRLYDAEAVISRSVGYAVLTAALVATFAGSEALIEMLGQRYLGSGIGQVSGAIAAALAAVLLSPLNDRISSWVEHHFQRNLVQLRTRVPEMLAHIPGGWSPRQIGQSVLLQIADAIHATSAAIVINDKIIAAEGLTARQVRRSRDQFPLRLPLSGHLGEVKGSLLIGPRPDGSSYGRDETEAVEAVSFTLGRVLLTSLEQDKNRREIQDFNRSMKTQLDDLTNRLLALEELVGSQPRGNPRGNYAIAAGLQGLRRDERVKSLNSRAASSGDAPADGLA